MKRVHGTSKLIGGRYQLVRLLGKGGSSLVYVGRDIRLEQEWAVKAIRDQDWPIYKREVGMLQQLSHPGLVRIADVIHESGVTYIIMDLIRGRTLRQVMYEGKISEEDVLQWGMEVADILAYLHKQEPSVIYRDVKPSNLILDHGGHIRIIDFGICYRPGDVFVPLGTPGYAAPEQYDIHKGVISDRTDVYGLCMTLLALASGMEPCTYERTGGYIRESKRCVSRSFWRLCRMGIQSRPAKRYQDIVTLRKRMENLLSSNHRRQRKRRKRKYIWGIWAMIVLSVLGIRSFNQTNRRNKVEKYREPMTYGGTDQDYRKAIELFPYSVEAYLSLLNTYLADGTFTGSEEETMVHLISAGGNRLKENSTYQELAFQMGLAYAAYGDRGRRSQAVPWFMEAEGIGGDDRICRLAGACAFLENFEQEMAKDMNEEEERQLYRDLFHDMVAITDDAKRENNPGLQMLVRKEVAEKMETYGDEMRRNGVKDEEWNQLKEDIRM